MQNDEGRCSTSLQGIDSILSMDDTILRSIEDDFIDEGNEGSVNIINDQSNMEDMFKTQGFFVPEEDFEFNIQHSRMPTTENKTLDTLLDLPDEEEWQDNSFLNAAFTQLSTSSDKEIILDDEINIQSSVHTAAEVEYMNSSENHVEPTVFSSKQELYIGPSLLDDYHVDEQYLTESSKQACIINKVNINKAEQSVTLPKRCLAVNQSTFPNKKICVNQSESSGVRIKRTNSSESSSFYGLPHNVKKLILRVKGIDRLYEWQDECLNLEAVKKKKNLIYALPTSGGKTLVAEILMFREIVCDKKSAIFILPFVAIVQEKVQSIAPFALELDFLVEEYAAAKGTYPPKKRRKKNSVYICTIEKASGLINSLIETNRLHEIGIIVVDELHLLGENGGRGATLEALLTKVLYVNANVHIVGMSATIGNLEEIAQFLNADLYTQNFRPIEIKEYIKCDDSIWLLNLNTDTLLTDEKKVVSTYTRDAALMDPDRIGVLVMDVVPKDSCLIFCATRKNCENVALLLSKVLPRTLLDHKKKEKQTVLMALKNEEGLCPILCKTIRYGVAYHHSGLTSEERRLLEDAFREGTICVICCTSTLAAGVNLPARRVILRSPYVGNQFLNLSKYKQMIGRAGRAGMGNIGESILICRNNELLKVKELVVSKMDDSLSTLHEQTDRGINNLILSATLLSIAKTRAEIHKLCYTTLLNIQQQRLDINVKKIADNAISKLLKSGFLQVRKNQHFNTCKPNISVVIPSQTTTCDVIQEQKKEKKKIVLTYKTELELCNLGRAAMKGGIDLQYAYILYQDLKIAQKHLILIDYLHLLYLVTPYDVAGQIKPVGSIYYDVVTNLSQNHMEIARLLGITEVTVSKLRNGIMPKNVDARVVHRFYVTLILYDLWIHHAVYVIAEKYQVSRGIVQNLLNGVLSFGSSVVRFCQELEEFWSFAELFSAFNKKLSYCCPAELEILMELPTVKIGRARQLYNAGYRTLQSIVKAKPEELQEKIPYLNRKVVMQIIAAANLLILRKVEDLKDEVQDVLEGVDIDNLI
ncbi:hypothetical protein KM043_005125 [Ampulex compressa]|nr:hypothetical protein KM043_005125 [Ampulex compressa]